MKTFEDYRQEISIIDLATANGYELLKEKGNRYPVLFNRTSNDRIVIINANNSVNQGYFNPDDDKDKGTLISFIQNRLGTLFVLDTAKSPQANINLVLNEFLKLDRPVTLPETSLSPKQSVTSSSKDTASEFSIHQLEIQPLKNRDYLKGRGITDQTLDAPVFQKKVFNVKLKNHINTGFPYYEANSHAVSGWELRNAAFGGHAKESDRAHSVWLSNIPSITKSLTVSESPIDSISHYQLTHNQNGMYAAFGGRLAGGQIETLKQLISKIPVTKDFIINLASDNDRTGAQYDLKFIKELITSRIDLQDLTVQKDKVSLTIPPTKDISFTDSIVLAEKLSERLQAYNDRVDAISKGKAPNRFLLQEIALEKVVFTRANDSLAIEIPNNALALNFFNQALLKASGFNQKIAIHKAILKDFNEDLQLMNFLQQTKKMPIQYSELIQSAKEGKIKTYVEDFKKFSEKQIKKQPVQQLKFKI